MIDWSINVGHILTGLGLFGGAVGLIYVMRHEVSEIKKDIGDVKDDLKAMAGAMVQLARQEERLNSHDRRITKLEDDG